MTPEAKQLELEAECTGLGVRNYTKARMPWHRDERKLTPESELPPGQILTRRAVLPLAEAIKDWCLAALSGRARFNAPAARVLDLFPDQTVVAFITAKIVVNSFTDKCSIQRLSLDIARWVLFEHNLQLFKKTNPGYFHVLDRSLKERTSDSSWRARVLRDAFQKSELQTVEMSQPERMKLGMTLVLLMIESTGLCEKVTLPDLARGGNKKITLVQPTEATREWLERQHEHCALMQPMLMPMVCKPVEWAGPSTGGYLTPGFCDLHVVKTVNRHFLEELEDHEMGGVYDALNTIQNTRWAVNKPVLAVMQALWRSGNVLCGMPERSDEALPAKPVILGDAYMKDTPEFNAALSQWKTQARKVHERNALVRPARLLWLQRLWLAEKFEDEEAIYFPHHLDWRGRAYPIPVVLNPQADDPSKALLRFADGKPLGESGGFWLAVHVANLWAEDSGNGVKTDKLSLEERVQWVQANSDLICMCANAPLDFLWWTRAEKKWQFLAACIEWDGFMREGDGFVSHLPVALDGACSGLQHFSAMIRDEEGGRLVNLVPSDRPEDIYSAVAAKAAEIVDAEVYESEYAQLWQGKVTRKLAKRPTMTTCYGVTDRGIFDQTLDLVQKEERDGNVILGLDDPKETARACHYMAMVLKRAISESMVSASNVMGWLQGTASTVAKDGLPVRWVTPTGFPVIQAYRKPKSKFVSSFVGSTRVKLACIEPTSKIDSAKQKQGIAPNFVHSLDAAHMMMTLHMCKANHMEAFAMIHDSFGVHAPDCDKLAALVREAFVELYSADVLSDLRDQLIDQLPVELAEKIGPLPAPGALDLDLVRESDFFFA